MKNIVLVVGEYYPYFSAVGNCCNNIAEELAKDYNVTIICAKSQYNELEKEEYNGQTIYRVSFKWWDRRLILNTKIKNSNGLKLYWYKFLLNIVRGRDYLLMIFSKTSIKKDLYKAFINKLNEIKIPIDAIIPFCFPMETVFAAMKYKDNNTNTQLIPYLFDPFVESYTLHRTRWNRKIKTPSNKKIEIDMLKKSTNVFCAYQLHEHFLQYKGYEGKVIPTEHPLLKPKVNGQTEGNSKHDDSMLFTYAGAFEYTIRNPEYFLRTMLIFLNEFDAKLNIYSNGNCNYIVEKYSNQLPDKINNYGYRPKKEVDDILANSNFLISVGNIDNKQVPSKVFEYMSLGKPIINFYSFDDDYNVKILENYPLSLCLKEDESLMEENIYKLEQFVKENNNKTIEFEKVKKIFYLGDPEYIATQIKASIK